MQMRQESDERERQEKAEAEEKALRAQRQAEWVRTDHDIHSVDIVILIRTLHAGVPPLTGEERGTRDARDTIHATQKLPDATRHAHTDRGTH